VAREFSFDAPCLIVSQPTRGIDVGAIEAIHQEILDQCRAGAGVLLVSAELDEIYKLSDRILVIYEGKIMGEFDPQQVTKEEIGLYMTGAKRARCKLERKCV
jgi:general nucleoside transport system ATP-binding protein